MTVMSTVVQGSDEIVKKPFTTTYHSFNVVNNLIVVQAELGGIPGNYIFDTGSTGLVLNVSDKTSVGANMVAITGISSSENAYSTQVEVFQFGSILKRQFEATCMPLQHIEASMNMEIDGLIGMDVLNSTAISIDFTTKMIVLSNPSSEVEKADVQIDLEFEHGIPIIQSSINGTSVNLAIDFGATSSILHESFVQQHQLQVVEQIDLLTTNGTTKAMDKVRCDNLVIGESFQFNTNAIVADLSHLQSDHTSIDGILGIDLLRTGKVMINPSQRKFYIWLNK